MDVTGLTDGGDVKLDAGPGDLNLDPKPGSWDTGDWDDLTVEQVLDVPNWTRNLDMAEFDTMASFESFVRKCEDIAQLEMASHHYDTFTSLIEMYTDYRSSGQSLYNFVPGYNKDLSRHGMSCVGLSRSLIHKLRLAFPHFARCIALVSCEEVVKDYGTYAIESPNNLKEHVLVVARFCLPGNRLGYVILDPGYHVARAAIAMADEQYPHTSWFTQSSTGSVVKEYNYQLSGDSFLIWHVRETRNGNLDQWSNLIFVSKAFAKSITITQKRALFYGFKSLVIRDKKAPIAGLYCYMKKKQVTIFYDEDKVRKQAKFDLAAIECDEVNGHLVQVAKHFRNTGFPQALDFLKQTLCALKIIMEDEEFLADFFELDEWLEDEEA
ncbi:hypothetical protein HDE_03054 [Halotydeus destructor]|nr:hypothetical protein HDE_03054 [Halotydeus destructor]